MLSARGTVSDNKSLVSRNTTEQAFNTISVGGARFKTPAPLRDQPHPFEMVHEDPIRYIKQRAGDKKEGVRNYINDTREMLRLNVGIVNRKHEIVKLEDMIDEEEKKLNSAREAFYEETGKFNTFMFESKQITMKLEQQAKEAHEHKQKLAMQIAALNAKIEGLDTELKQKDELLDFRKADKEFLERLIREFRPQLISEEGLVPAVVGSSLEENDKVFLTQKLKNNKERRKNQQIKLQDVIPISKDDVQKFVSELSDENLFMIKLINDLKT